MNKNRATSALTAARCVDRLLATLCHTGRSTAKIGFSSVAMHLMAVVVAVALGTPEPSSADVSSRGTYQTAIEIEVPLYHSITPRIALSYDSNSGNGPLGMGWRLEADSRITRVSPGGGAPRHNSSDRLWVDGLELLPCQQNSSSLSCRSGGTHYTSIEDFQRYQRDTPQPNTWTVWRRDGARLLYTPQLGDPTSPDGPLRWALAEIVDTHGNRVRYSYQCSLSACLIDTISYGEGTLCISDLDRPRGTILPGARIEFRWEARPDTLSMAQGGYLEEVSRRLKAIDVANCGGRVRVYALSYAPDLQGSSGYRLNRSFLASIQVYGRDAVLEPDGSVSSGTALPPRTFEAPAQIQAPAPAFANVLDASDFLPQFPTQQTISPVYSNRVVQRLPPTVVIGTDPEGGSIPLRVTSRAGVLVSDFDGDTRLDFMQWTLDGSCSQLQTRTVLRSTSQGSIDDSNPWPGATTCDSRMTGGLAADIDGDHRGDALFLQYRRVSPFDPNDLSYQLDLVANLSNGDGTFSASGTTTLFISLDLDEALRSRCAVGDPNGDGRADLICLTRQQGAWAFVQGLSDGSGAFRVLADPAPTDSSPASMG